LVSKGQRPAVASMSLNALGRLANMRSAIDWAAQSGVTVVVAAGNEDDSACGYSPAFVPNAITVGATTESNARASYSNYGSCVDIYAPGSAIVSAWSFYPSSSHVLSGTSIAVPHVAGGAALLLGTNPSWTPAQVSAGLKSTAENGVISNLHSSDTNIFLSVRDAVPPRVEPVLAEGDSKGPSLVSVLLLVLSAAFFFCRRCLVGLRQKTCSSPLRDEVSQRA